MVSEKRKVHLITLLLLAPLVAVSADNLELEPSDKMALCSDDGQGVERRRPGRPADKLSEREACHAEGRAGISPWRQPIQLGTEVPDRWRIVESLGIETNLWDPYNGQNPLKGDRPVWGKDWFYSLIAISDTFIEPRRFPIPVGVATTTRPGSLDTIGRGETFVFAQNIILENVIYKGDTVFRPPDWEFRITPVLNYNQVHADEKGLLNVDPDLGGRSSRQRKDSFVGLQSMFVDKHLRDVSPRYDFDSVRVGIQPFAADFRGFLFQDAPLGVRVFGTRKNNRFQYNLAAFQRLEKDTNSGLNDVTQRPRDDFIFAANLYWQDYPRLGFISQATVVHNINREKGDVEYDKNGFIARPASIFEERFNRNYDVTYLGYSGDGHFGRLNLSASGYLAFGNQASTRYRGVDEEIRASFFAVEASVDFDWLRPRLSLLYASGDSDPYDLKAEGYDAIFENPLFAGADTSFFIRQNVPLIGGGGVTLTGRNGILPSLRSSKEQGQSNFINPGIKMLGLGVDADLLPVLRLSLNWNYFSFDKTEVLEAVRQQAPVNREFGHDVSASLIWRPYMSQNVVLRLSAAALNPGKGFEDLYGSDADTPYSVLLNLTLMY